MNLKHLCGLIKYYVQSIWSSWDACNSGDNPGPWSAEPNKQGFSASFLIHFGCLLFPGTGFVTADRWEVPDTVDDSNYSKRQILGESWLRAYLPAPSLLPWFLWMGSHSLYSAHSVTVLLSASNFHPASVCQCWDTAEMVTRFAPKPPPTPLACCISLFSEAGQAASLRTLSLPTSFESLWW